MFLAFTFYALTSYVILMHETDLVFHPHQLDATMPLEARPQVIPYAEQVVFPGDDGRKLHGYFVQSGDYCDENTIPVLYCHGNGGNCVYSSGWVFFPHESGPSRFALMTFDYRAYGFSEGKKAELNEFAVYSDARTARKWLAEKVGKPETSVALMGHSLGGGVVCDLAQDGASALILCSTFDSVPDTAQSYCMFLPAKLLMKNQFASAEKLSKVHVPVLQFHDPTDGTVPYRNGQRLYAHINEPKEFVVLNGLGHNYHPNIEMREKIISFLEKYGNSEKN
ncbi:MAG: alpha/beta hydrolase [Thermoguttaceae bacterium]|nr:alpha/beta hydrolase [Thermoguttaceae bacterium]MBR0193614.1 alpha/beta hydrolase [Thermoguttaceae bacterium]